MTSTRLKVAHFDVVTDGDLLLCEDVSVPVAFEFSPIQISQTQLCQKTTLLTLKLWEPLQILDSRSFPRSTEYRPSPCERDLQYNRCSRAAKDFPEKGSNETLREI